MKAELPTPFELSRFSDRLSLLVAELSQVQADLAQAEASLRSTGPTLPAMGYGSIREGILDVLKDNPNGVRSREVANILRLRMGVEIGRRTHSTTLSRLKREGIAVESGGRWFLNAKT